MIDLKNINGDVEIRLDIVGYQFPDDPKDNWLFLALTVNQNGRILQLIDPAIETTDLVTIYEWFTDLSQRRLPKFSRLDFIEPCICFEFLGCKKDTVRIAIEFSHELRPNFMITQLGNQDYEWEIIFELTDIDFRNSIFKIIETMEKYPIRD